MSRACVAEELPTLLRAGRRASTAAVAAAAGAATKAPAAALLCGRAAAEAPPAAVPQLRRGAPSPLELPEDELEGPATPSPKLRVKNTFLDWTAPCSPSLDGFFLERPVRTCPARHIGRLSCFSSALADAPLGGLVAPFMSPCHVVTPCRLQTPCCISTPLAEDRWPEWCSPSAANALQHQAFFLYYDGAYEDYFAADARCYASGRFARAPAASVYSLETAYAGRVLGASSEASNARAEGSRRPRPVLSLVAALDGATAELATQEEGDVPSSHVAGGAVVVPLEPAVLPTPPRASPASKCLETVPHYAAPVLDAESALVKLGLASSFLMAVAPPPPPPAAPALGFEALLCDAGDA